MTSLSDYNLYYDSLDSQGKAEFCYANCDEFSRYIDSIYLHKYLPNRIISKQPFLFPFFMPRVANLEPHVRLLIKNECLFFVNVYDGFRQPYLLPRHGKRYIRWFR